MIDSFEPDIITYSDYYPFGWVMPGREGSSDHYRFGFNGMEKDYEIKGNGNSYDFGERIQDPRLGRWLSLDPLAAKYPSMSPYMAFGDDPINIIDPNGKELVEITIKTKSTAIKGKLKLIVDKEIAQDVKDLVKYAIDNDINVHFNSSFRSAKQQQGVQKSGTTPAKVGTSRHEGGFGLDFNLYDDKGNIISGNKTVTKETEFIKKAKELGFRWGGEFTKPDKIHIDAWPKGETKKHGYDSWSEAYKENQKDYRDGTYTKETYEYDKPVETKESETPVETEETPAASGG